MQNNNPSAKSTSALSFENTEIAFKGKSNADLNRSFWLFKLVSNNALVKIGSPITNFALKIGLPIKGIIRNTVFKHFCGGETIEGCKNSIDELASNHVGTILDYSVEGEETESVFDATCEEILKTVLRAQDDPNIPFSVFKPTGLGRFAIFEKLDSKQALTEVESQEFLRIKARIDRICKACYDTGVLLLIDAEHSWIQDSIDDIAREMMQKYNREKPVIYNTYQLYRIALMAGTHNDASSLLLANEMNKRKLDHANTHIFFAQLLGMSDNLSFNLSTAGYNVAKYMPYGPVAYVMPYLLRRAQENTSVGGQTGRELSLIMKEKKRRKNA